MHLHCIGSFKSHVYSVSLKGKKEARFNPKFLKKSKKKNHEIVISGLYHIYFSFIWYIGD